jgi:hypothetical protein
MACKTYREAINGELWHLALAVDGEHIDKYRAVGLMNIARQAESIARRARKELKVLRDA